MPSAPPQRKGELVSFWSLNFLVPLGNEELGGGFKDFVIYLNPWQVWMIQFDLRISERHWATHQVEEGFETF